MNRTLTVHLSLRTVVLTLGVLLAVYVASLIPDILVMLLVALILAAAMLPGVDHFQHRLRWPRLPSVLAMFGVIFLFLLLLGLIVIPTLIDQAQTLIKDLPAYTDKVRQTYSWVLGLEARFPWLPPPSELAKQVSAFAAGWLTSSLGWAGRILGGVMTLFVVLITTFFILIDGPDLKRGLLALIPPLHRPKWAAQFDPVALKLGAYVQGVLVSIGFLTTYLAIALSIAGVPLAMALAIMAGVMEIIPLVGSLLGSIPAILVALTVSWQLALITAGIFLLGNFLQGNFVAPYVFSKSVEVSPVMILFALLIGAQLMGIAGALIAVPVMAAAIVLVQNLYVEPMERLYADQEAAQGVVGDKGVVVTQTELEGEQTEG